MSASGPCSIEGIPPAPADQWAYVRQGSDSGSTGSTYTSSDDSARITPQDGDTDASEATYRGALPSLDGYASETTSASTCSFTRFVQELRGLGDIADVPLPSPPTALAPGLLRAVAPSKPKQVSPRCKDKQTQWPNPIPASWERPNWENPTALTRKHCWQWIVEQTATEPKTSRALFEGLESRFEGKLPLPVFTFSKRLTTWKKLGCLEKFSTSPPTWQAPRRDTRLSTALSAPDRTPQGVAARWQSGPPPPSTRRKD